MLDAANDNPRPEIECRQTFVEELELPEANFDLVVNSLMFHYIGDLKPVFEKIHSWLRVGGNLVFSIEHPIMAAGQGVTPG